MNNSVVNSKNVSETAQTREWQGTFGKKYWERNQFTPAELDALYLTKYGTTRTILNERFLKNVPRSTSILEVGCNLGAQLSSLQRSGFTNLSGIEINGEILKEARIRLPSAKLAQASALQIPYPDAHFDLVFTSGLLIHIAPSELVTAMNEIHRCSKTWIWGLEYYAPETTEVLYRGQRNLLWKADFVQLYLKNFPDLELVREERLSYLKDGNVDTMFLLRRTG
jgi:pseudaminic acid biosynthesis-associated methylase